MTCVRIDLDDDDVITGLAIAPRGPSPALSTYDSGSDSYLFDDRLQLPGFVLDLYPGLQALFKGSATLGPTCSSPSRWIRPPAILAALTADAGYCGSAGSTVTGTAPSATPSSRRPSSTPRLDRLAGAGSLDACAIRPCGGHARPEQRRTDALTRTSPIDLDASTTPTAPPTSIAATALRPARSRTRVGCWSVFLLGAVPCWRALDVRAGSRPPLATPPERDPSCRPRESGTTNPSSPKAVALSLVSRSAAALAGRRGRPACPR